MPETGKPEGGLLQSVYKLLHFHRPPAKRWQVIGASVQGTMHAKMGIPCQDAHAFQLLPHEILLAAVSDGASSAQHSEEGAQLAVRVLSDYLAAQLSTFRPLNEAVCRRIMRGAFLAVQRSLVELAAAQKTSLSAFACTLTAVFYNGEWLVAGQIGDGVAVAESATGSLFSLTRPKHGEYANETYFLTMETALQYLEINTFQCRVQSLALMTDGIIRLAMHLDQNLPHDKFFQPLLNYARSVKDTRSGNAGMESFLASARVSARSHDDKTLVIATACLDNSNGHPD